MLGLAPLTAAPLSDDGDRLPRITIGTSGEVALDGNAEGEARTAAVLQVATPPVIEELVGVGRINANGTGDVPCAGNGAANGRITGAAAASFATSATAAAALRSAAGIAGDIALNGQSSGRLESAGAARRLWDLEGTSDARTTLMASGSGLWGPTGAARANIGTQSNVAGTITIARRFEAASAIAVAAVRGLALQGLSQGANVSVGASDSSLGLDAVIQTKVVHAVALIGKFSLNGYAATDAISSARVDALGPGLVGQTFGTTLDARFAQAAGQIGTSVNARSLVQTTAIADASLFASMDTRGNVSSRSAMAGTLSLARELSADVLASGEAGRQIGLEGAASGFTETTVDTPAGEFKVTGTSEARSGNCATMRHELFVSDETELASSIFGAATNTFEWAGTSDAITIAPAVVEAEASLQGESLSANSINAEATDDLTILGTGAGNVSPVVQLRSDFVMAGASMGAISSFGLGRGIFDVARSFLGDVDVFGDSARAVGLAGQATVNSAAIGTVPVADAKIAGSANATSISFTSAAAQVLVSGAATGRLQSAAAIQSRLEIDLVVEGASPQTAKSNVTWATEDNVDATLALMGSADGDLTIATSAATRAMLAARISGAWRLTGETTIALEARANAAGVLTIRRDSDAAADIDGDAHRTINLHGSCEARANITAKPRPLPLTVTLTAEADNAAHGRASSEITTAAFGIAQVKSHATSQSHLAITRTGAADVLILGTAWRGMPFLGTSQARSPALAAANSSVMPGLAAAVANVIHLDLRAEAIAPGGEAAGSNLACAQEVSPIWDFDMAAIAFRAPPALGRLEPPRLGLSGRLVPTNTGRILRG